MMINNTTKTMINKLQCRLVPCYESDNILLIFNNKAELLKYKRRKKYICHNEILRTIDELNEINKLDGIRFKRYYFM